MSVSTPTINRIYRVTEYDLLRTAITANNMYICTDSLQMYYDESAVKRAQYAYTGIKTINDLLYDTTPNYGTSYYCWEDNSLWIWLNKWITLYSDTTYPSAYVYTTYPSTSEPGTLNSIYNINNVLDNNGLLQDGSVVIRDKNRIIKGKFYVNDDNDNLTFSSFLGGGIRLLPNGAMDTDGEFYIDDEGESFLRSSFTILNGEEYIDYSEHPELDENPYTNSDHRYKVYHEGNLDTSAILTMTPEQIYTKLQDSSLPDPLDLSVTMISGKTIDDLALVGHTHTASEITNFNEQARNQAAIEIRTVLNSMTGNGITISSTGTSDFSLSANDFTLTFTNGVIGAATVSHLTDTTISLTVDPTKHVHENVITRLDDLQEQINDINAMDANNYYTTTQVDNLISSVTGTSTPTAGKPLLVNSEGKLPATATAADQLSEYRTITFQGDITGVLSTDFSQDSTVTLDASNILSSTPVTGKALLVDSSGNLPGNAETASALDHTISINLTNEVVGTGQLNTANSSMSISCTLVPGDNILQTKDLGVTVANLDENGLVPTSLLPSSATGGLLFQGTFLPTDGYPATSPSEGDFWIAATDGELDGVSYVAGDWCLYLNGGWLHITQSNSVTSVNGYIGDVVLTADDVDAISTDYIDYTLGETIPSGYIVRASDDGTILGARIEGLVNSFQITTDSESDVEVSSSSTNPSTDGTEDISLNLQISDSGIAKLNEEIGYSISSDTEPFDYRHNLVFGSGLTVTDNGEDTLTIEVSSSASQAFNTVYVNLDDTSSAIQQANTYLYLIETTPFLFVVDVDIDEFTDKVPVVFVVNNISNYEANTYTYQGVPIYTVQNGSIAEKILKRYDLELVIVAELGTISTSITSITLNKTVTTVPFLTTEEMENSTAFVPTEDYQPATKLYVDNVVSSNSISSNTYTGLIGNGSSTVYTVTHNLNSSNVIVQFRNSDNEQIYVDNRVIDSNTLQVTFTEAPTTNSISVNIFKL